jgi:putative flippase GtrA
MTDKQRSTTSQLTRFILTGGIAAAVNIGARWLLEFSVRYEVAVALAYVIGMTTAFILARAFVFAATTGDPRRQYSRFALVNIAAFAQVWLVSVGLARYAFPAMGFTWHPETIAHTIGVMSPVFVSYIGHRDFSFRQ